MSLKEEMTLEEMPYEKCFKYGPGVLTDIELLAIFIRTGTKMNSCIDLARMILGDNRDGNALLRVMNYDIPKLQGFHGLGRVKALQISCMMELSKRIWRLSKGSGQRFNDAETTASYYMEEMRHLKTEHTKVLLLNIKGMLIKDMYISVGTINSSMLSPREIFIEALKYEAVNIIVLHNHPSGDPTPSQNDIAATGRLAKAGALLGIKLLDHIIIGDNRFVSLAAGGFLD